MRVRRPPQGESSPTTYRGETVEAFVPSDLPPFPPLELDDLYLSLDKANAAIGGLNTLASLLPDPDLFLYSFIRREALLSSQIEGTQSSLSDLLLSEIDSAPGAPIEDDVREVSNYVNALEHAVERLRGGGEIDLALICEVHARLLRSGRGSKLQPGVVRDDLVWIGGARPWFADFVPPPADEVPRCMTDLVAFINDPELQLPLLVRAALAHVQFETIHPFFDGNGRVGRLLISLMLHQAGMLEQPILYLSLYLKRHRANYYYYLDYVRRQGDWEAWLDFFINGIADTAQTAVNMAQRLSSLIERDRGRVQVAQGRSTSAAAVHDAITRRPLRTIRALTEDTGFSAPTVSTALNMLTGLGITRETSGRRRDRVFVYDEYLNILNEDLEPL